MFLSVVFAVFLAGKSIFCSTNCIEPNSNCSEASAVPRIDLPVEFFNNVSLSNSTLSINETSGLQRKSVGKAFGNAVAGSVDNIVNMFKAVIGGVGSLLKGPGNQGAAPAPVGGNGNSGQNMGGAVDQAPQYQEGMGQASQYQVGAADQAPQYQNGGANQAVQYQGSGLGQVPYYQAPQQQNQGQLSHF